jgi:uncharacterized protein (DUF1015 family)
MYRDIMREKNNDSADEVKPYDFVMMMFVNCFDPGLMILPTHRAVSIKDDFDEAKFIKELSAISAVTKLESYTNIGGYLSSIETPGRFVMVAKTACYGVNLAPELFEPYNPAYRNVDAYLLQKSVLENLLGMTEEQILKKQDIYFFQEFQDVVSHVHKFNSLGFILKAASLETIRQVAENGLTMPQKTTYFFPKLATGLLFNQID